MISSDYWFLKNVIFVIINTVIINTVCSYIFTYVHDNNIWNRPYEYFPAEIFFTVTLFFLSPNISTTLTLIPDWQSDIANAHPFVGGTISPSPHMNRINLRVTRDKNFCERTKIKTYIFLAFGFSFLPSSFLFLSTSDSRHLLEYLFTIYIFSFAHPPSPWQSSAWLLGLRSGKYY